MEIEEVRKFYYQCGIELPEKPKNKQLLGECPFCEKTKFYVNSGNGQFDCKVCGETGNRYTFIDRFHALCLEHTTKTDMVKLAKIKELPTIVIKKNKIAYNFLTGNYIFLGLNKSKKPVNLYHYNIDENIILASTAMKQHLFGIDALTKDKKRPIFLIEGHWDWFTIDHCLRVLKKRKQYDLLATPGSQTFNEEWTMLLNRRIVFLVYDNDKAGRDGMNRVIKKITESEYQPSELSMINWHSSFPEKYDVKDLYVKGIPEFEGEFEE